MSENDAEARRATVQLLQGGGCASSAFASAAQSQPREQRLVQPVSALQSGSAAELPHKQLAMYTMKLHEWAAERNHSVRYTYEQLAVDPPLWECTVATTDGLVLKDIGKNKKNAQHMASMKACKAQGLRV